jgi:hypothetical protein
MDHEDDDNNYHEDDHEADHEADPEDGPEDTSENSSGPNSVVFGIEAALKTEWTNMSTDEAGNSADTSSQPKESTKTFESPPSQDRRQDLVKIHSKDATVKNRLGWKCEIKELYSSTASACSCCTAWEDEKPFREDDKKSERDRERNEFALVRKQQPHGAHGGWHTYSIEINSPLIRARLVDIFDNYPAVDTNTIELSFRPPFLPFVHRWDRFLQLIDEEEPSATKDHLQLLQNLVKPEIENSIAILQHIESTGRISHDNLQLAFVPGKIVIRDMEGTLTAGVLHSSSYKKDAFSASVRVLDWNGETFGVRECSWKLSKYKGSPELASLSLSPLDAHTDKEAIRNRLIERGKRFRNLRGQHHLFYSGRAYGEPSIFERWIYGHGEIAKPVSALSP